MDILSAQIDYSKIAAALSFYSSIGYVNIEVPWWVSFESIDATIPSGATFYEVVDHYNQAESFGYPVASGEQSFLEIRSRLKDAIQLSKELGKENRKFACATPCFRHEAYDKYHLPQFFKVELIEVCPDNPEQSIERIVSDAQKFFSLFLSYRIAARHEQAGIVKTDIGYDIFMSGVELGSYGYRQVDFGREPFDWVYGTGVAEPRLSTVLSDFQKEDL
jgi:seryl-tRNA synthetase